MQTPQGHAIQNGIAVPVDWLAIIFNPSFPYRLAHMTTAAYLTTSFVVLAVGARYLLAGKFPEEAKTMLRMGVGFAAIVAPLQLFIGDQHGLNTLKHQPIKVAAMEAHWDGSKPGALVCSPGPTRRTRETSTRLRSPMRRRSCSPTRDRTVSRPEERAAAGPPAGEERLLLLPHHGRHRSLHDRVVDLRRVPVVAQQIIRHALVSLADAIHMVVRIHCGHRGLDGDGARTPTLARAGHLPDSGRNFSESPEAWCSRRFCSTSRFTPSCSRWAFITSTG
jgi:hypothetical protein